MNDAERPDAFNNTIQNITAVVILIVMSVSTVTNSALSGQCGIPRMLYNDN